MGKVIMYSMVDCPTCLYAKRMLAKGGIQFEAIEVDDDAALQEKVVELTGQRTVPVFVHPSGEVEVGYRGNVG